VANQVLRHLITDMGVRRDGIRSSKVTKVETMQDGRLRLALDVETNPVADVLETIQVVAIIDPHDPNRFSQSNIIRTTKGARVVRVSGPGSGAGGRPPRVSPPSLVDAALASIAGDSAPSLRGPVVIVPETSPAETARNQQWMARTLTDELKTYSDAALERLYPDGALKKQKTAPLAVSLQSALARRGGGTVTGLSLLKIEPGPNGKIFYSGLLRTSRAGQTLRFKLAVSPSTRAQPVSVIQTEMSPVVSPH
jgi:hypothetical protein